MSPPLGASRPMTEHDVKVAGDIGEMKEAMRTVKHDVANIQQGILGLSDKLNSLNTDKAKGLGFFAGASFIVATFGGVLLAAAKILFASGKMHP